MHKSAARYEQSRTVRAVIDQRRNDHVDPAAFASDDEWTAARDRLVVEKRVLEADAVDLKARIVRAQRHRGRDGKRVVPSATTRSWEVARTTVVKRISEIEAALVDLKARRPTRTDDWGADEHRRFSFLFYRAAKEMLAEPVFERVRIAALHRFADANDGAEQ
jgi:hypothetical protein